MAVDPASMPTVSMDVANPNAVAWFNFMRSSAGSIQAVGDATGYVITLYRSNDGKTPEPLLLTLTPGSKFAEFDCSTWHHLCAKVTQQGTGTLALVPCGKSDRGG